MLPRSPKQAWPLLLASLACMAVAPPVAAASHGKHGSQKAHQRCQRVAAPDGSDYARGTRSHPFRTTQRLVNALKPGQTGCLRRGSYDADEQVRVSTPRIKLTSHSRKPAILRARLVIANDASRTTVSHLRLVGRSDNLAPSMTINGDGVTLRGNDITNFHTTTCISVGSPHTYGRAHGTLIADNEIHDCGRLPATNFDHGIYVNSADDTVIRGNSIHDNADRGVQFYPDAQRSLVVGNVIRANGEGVIFGGDSDSASSDNVLAHNLIVNSKIRHNVEAFWVGPIGTGNVVRHNCVGGGADDAGDGGVLDTVGFTATSNLLVRGRVRGRCRGLARRVAAGLRGPRGPAPVRAEG